MLLFCSVALQRFKRHGGWQRSDFYLGIELIVFALWGMVTLKFSPGAIAVAAERPSETSPSYITCSLACVLCALAFVIVLHQDWRARHVDPRGQWIRLGVISNGAGVVCIALYALFLSGVLR